GQRVSGGKIEALLIREESEGIWQAKLKNLGRVKIGETLCFCENAIKATLTEKYPDGSCSLKFVEAKNLFQLLKRHGYAPIPAYIRKVRKDQPEERNQDLTTYQTVFARKYGAVAAPTAGLHFSEKILETIKLRDIDIFSITLHVGPGTFEPVRVEDVRQHKMHREYYEISDNVANAITTAKKQGKKIVAVGTTTARTLESAWSNNELVPGNSSTDIFIYPPYQFKIVDQLLTNFHLPESTLMMLVSAFAGKEPIMDAYRAAIKEKYRFYSYGDCMLLK
ncbi:MAG: tRNA preQ1(34) S-adenosylmethionine ribosyltransferase-isomerase QueA, partial [Proteobacteria bacterium]|nr:tRNA preQ1(34) S-adenosylmethionine ribosyltransferase-isomerase QueA [Pseudomonadota bacterium]